MTKTIQLDLGKEVSFYDDRKDQASPRAGNVSVQSYGNSRYIQMIMDANGGFRGPRKWDYVGLPKDIRHVGGADGIGTATAIADALLFYSDKAMRLIGRNFIAMVADDRIQNGDLPLVVFNDISVRQHHEQGYDALLQGLGDVLKEQELVMVGGETATLGACIGSPFEDTLFPFNLSGVAIGVNHPLMEVDGSKVNVGDYIVALKQDGFGSNGLTKAREALTLKYGKNYHIDAPKEVLEAVIAPCIVYSRAIAEALGWYNPELVNILNAREKPGLDIHAISHLSGGGIFEKFGKPILNKKGLSAIISNPYPIPQIALDLYAELQKLPNPMSIEEFFKTWCNGQRMLVTLGTLDEAEKFVKIVSGFGIEAKVAGQITETPKGRNSSITIHT